MKCGFHCCHVIDILLLVSPFSFSTAPSIRTPVSHSHTNTTGHMLEPGKICCCFQCRMSIDPSHRLTAHHTVSEWFNDYDIHTGQRISDHWWNTPTDEQNTVFNWQQRFSVVLVMNKNLYTSKCTSTLQKYECPMHVYKSIIKKMYFII